MKLLFEKIINKISFYLHKLKNILVYFFYRIKGLIIFSSYRKKFTKINLCSGPVLLPGYLNIDKGVGVDLVWDIGKSFPPFFDNSIDVLVCISSINYFTRERGRQIIKEVYRILKTGGVARFATQDLEAIAKKYINRDETFFFQKNADGKDRFRGTTMCDKINSWFYGYKTAGGVGKYFYDYETLALLFREAGFRSIEKKNYRESRIENIETIDNRADQMFFLEAVK